MAEYDAHAADYDAWAADSIDDVQWYVSLARAADEPIVELAVGTGRVAVPIARETGKRVIGIDHSPAMLAIGRKKAGDLPIDFRQGDMRDFTVEPGGRFAWNVFAFDPFVAVANEGNDVRNVAADNRIDLVRDQGVLSLWWMTRAEQEGLLDVAGLEVEALFGGCHREPYDDTTFEMVWIARKP